MTNFNAYLAAGQMLEVKTRERISVYNPNATAVTISVTFLVRQTATSNNQ